MSRGVLERRALANMPTHCSHGVRYNGTTRDRRFCLECNIDVYESQIDRSRKNILAATQKLAFLRNAQSAGVSSQKELDDFCSNKRPSKEADE